MRVEEEAKAKALRAQHGASNDKARQKREERARKRAEAARAAALANGGDPETVQREYDAAIASITGPKKEEEDKKGEDKVEVEVVHTAENTNIFTVVPGQPVLPELVPRASAELNSTPFPFPRTLRDHAIADAFDAMHAVGLRMGLGPRFGGEYLVYPGDYLRYHAHFTSQVIVRDDPIRPAELVAWGRLGTGTKKAGLLCCWDDGGRGDDEVKGKGEVEFYSLEWANFG